jgi:hypothetical protein
MKKTFFMLAAAVAMFAMPHAAQADLVIGFEFNTPGDTEDWQHNGANGGTGGTSQETLGDGTGVLTSTATTTDLRVLHNPDIVLDTTQFTNWTTVELRFRTLDIDGNVESLEDYNAGGTFFGLEPGTDADFNPISSGLLTQDGDFLTAEFDISAFGAADIAQIRIDPVGGAAGEGYEIDYVRINAAAIAVPEPSSLAILGLAGLGLAFRRRK